MAPQKNVSTDMDFGYLVKRKCINLSFHSLHDGNISILVKAIEKSKVLEQLNLWSNRIAFSDDQLADAIAQCGTLKIVSLGSNAVGPAGTVRLAGAIQRSASLRELHLGDNALGNEGAESIAEALAVNESLEMISLYGNGIGDGGVEFLAAALAKNGHVRAAWLHENKIGDKGAQRLAAVLDENPMLEQLFLVGNSIVDKDIVPGIEAKLADPVRSSKRAERLLAQQQQTQPHEGEVTDFARRYSDSRKDELLSLKDEEIAVLKAALESQEEEVAGKDEDRPRQDEETETCATDQEIVTLKKTIERFDEVLRRKDDETETRAKDREIVALKDALQRKDEEAQLVLQAMQTKVEEVEAQAREIEHLQSSLRTALRIQITYKDEELATLKALLARAVESEEESVRTEDAAAADKLLLVPRPAAAAPPLEDAREDPSLPVAAAE